MAVQKFFPTFVKRHVAPVAVLVAATLLISGCDLAANQMKTDRANNMEFQDYRDALAPRINRDDAETAAAAAAAAGADAGIPSLQSYVAQPSSSLKPMPLVSISVNQTVPLRDALFELAEQAGYDIELDPGITGSVIFTARDRPFDLVIKRLSEVAGLRYKFEDDTLRVEMDTPYNKTYKVDYLSYIRKNTGSIKNDVSVVSGGGANTGSQFQVSTESGSDFWGELETNLKQMLGVKAAALKTGIDPQITAAEQNPAPVEPVVVRDENGNVTSVTVTPPAATLQVNSLPTAAAPAADPGSAGAPGFAVNRQAGLITVFATERQHEQVRSYLDALKRAVTAQVLIEAKVMEVSLSDEFSEGIDWSQTNIFGRNAGIEFDIASPVNPALSPELLPAAQLRAFYTGGNFGAAIEAISRFGTIKALASPRLTVLNNQAAVLNVASNQVYFDIDITVTSDDNGTQTNVSSDIKNVPEGVLINVQPSIDLDARTVSMAVRPTITRIVSFVDDPSVQFVTAQNNIQGVSSQIPVVNVQEMDSVVNMDSGQAIVMGGLMQDRTDSTRTGVPVLSEVPLIGGLFRNHVDKISKTELVIFLKATIVDSDGKTISPTDKDLYKTFSGDRRPFKL